MGFKPKNKTIVLQFEDEDYAGMEVRMKSISVGKTMELLELANRSKESRDTKEITELFEDFARNLITWNLENEDDEPIPANLDGVKTLDLDFFMDLLMGWLDGMLSVSGPLGRKSTDGPSPNRMEVSIPMDIPHPNLGNLQKQD